MSWTEARNYDAIQIRGQSSTWDDFKFVSEMIHRDIIFQASCECEPDQPISFFTD